MLFAWGRSRIVLAVAKPVTEAARPSVRSPVSSSTSARVWGLRFLRIGLCFGCLAFGAEAKPCAVRAGQCFGCAFAARFRATSLLVAGASPSAPHRRLRPRRRLRRAAAAPRRACAAPARCSARPPPGARGRACDCSRARACGPRSAAPRRRRRRRADAQRAAGRECRSSRTTPPSASRCAGAQRFRSAELCFRRRAPG